MSATDTGPGLATRKVDQNVQLLLTHSGMDARTCMDCPVKPGHDKPVPGE